ncbi:MAG: AAA family ATPase [Saprospiraceae bacterium]|nr:AAA family ATPase [Saprospiraceae bacterium]
MTLNAILRPHAENAYAVELEALKNLDTRDKPASWNLSPWSVLLYIMGGKLEDGTLITPKYIGSKNLVEVAIATLLSDRALLLIGIPGTAKTWMSEHLAAAISGDSTLLVQGTAGTNEESLRYGWNYAQLIAKGPSRDALVPGPVMKAMNTGKLVRIEELTRIPTEVQDALITILSEKTLPIAELNEEVQAIQGFNVIATANDQDKGIHPLSSALQRRFNTLVMPLPETLEDEVRIVRQRIHQMEQMMQINLEKLKDQHTEKLVRMFRELREGISHDKKQKIKQSKATLSPAEAISIVHHARIQHHFFSDAAIGPAQIASGFVHSVINNDPEEKLILQEYTEAILKKRPEFKDWYEAMHHLLLDTNKRL